MSERAPLGWYKATCTGCYANYWQKSGANGTYCPRCSWGLVHRLQSELAREEARAESAEEQLARVREICLGAEAAGPMPEDGRLCDEILSLLSAGEQEG